MSLESRFEQVSHHSKEYSRECDISWCFSCSEKDIEKSGRYHRLYYLLEKLNSRPPNMNISCVKLDKRTDFLCHNCLPKGEEDKYYPAMPFFQQGYWYAKGHEFPEDKEFWESNKL